MLCAPTRPTPRRALAMLLTALFPALLAAAACGGDEESQPDGGAITLDPPAVAGQAATFFAPVQDAFPYLTQAPDQIGFVEEGVCGTDGARRVHALEAPPPAPPPARFVTLISQRVLVYADEGSAFDCIRRHATSYATTAEQGIYLAFPRLPVSGFAEVSLDPPPLGDEAQVRAWSFDAAGVRGHLVRVWVRTGAVVVDVSAQWFYDDQPLLAHDVAAYVFDRLAVFARGEQAPAPAAFQPSGLGVAVPANFFAEAFVPVAPGDAASGEPAEIAVQWDCDTGRARGTLRNISSASLRDVRVAVFFLDESGNQRATSATAYHSTTPPDLAPGESATFSVLTTGGTSVFPDARLTDCVLRFQACEPACRDLTATEAAPPAP